MQRYKVVWTDQAKKDLQAIFDHSLGHSKELALRTVMRIIRREDQLTSFPGTGPYEESLAYLNRGYRFLLEGNYKLIYSVREAKVYVHKVFYSRMNPDRLGEGL